MPSHTANEYYVIQINLYVIKTVWKFAYNFWNINISKIISSIRQKQILYYKTHNIIWSHRIESVAYCNHLQLVPVLFIGWKSIILLLYAENDIIFNNFISITIFDI